MKFWAPYFANKQRHVFEILVSMLTTAITRQRIINYLNRDCGEGELIIFQMLDCTCWCKLFLQCFDAVGWVSGRASGL